MPDTIRINRQRNTLQEKNNRLLPLLAMLFMIMLLSGLFVLWHIQRMAYPGNISAIVNVMRVSEAEESPEKWLVPLKEQPNNQENVIRTGSNQSIYLIWIPIEILRENMKKGGEVLYADHPNFIRLEAYWVKGTALEAVGFSRQFVLPFIELKSQEKLNNYDGLLICVEAAVNSFTISQVDRSEYYELQNWLLIYMLFVIGIIFAAFIIDTALALILREKAFSYHALFLASAMLYMYTSSGLSRISLADFKYYFFILGFSTVMSAVWFIDWYLNYKNKLTLYHSISKVLVFLGVIGVILCPFFLGTPAGILTVYKLLIAYGILASVWAMISLSIYLKYYDAFSLFFIIGSLFQAISVPLLAIGTTADTDYALILKLVYMLAAAINAVFYTLGIIHESRIFKEDSEYYFKVAITDPLTGAYNRYFIDTQLKYRLENGMLHERSTCYMMVDIDRFKAINDRYGHDIGDRVLIELVTLLQSNIRREDLLCRWGGEEFTILLNQTSLEDGLKIAEDLRVAVENNHFETVETVTISVGITTYREHETLESWFNRSDQLLYLAKASGRNCVKGE